MDDTLLQFLQSASRFASRIAIVCNPMAWMSQRVFRFGASRAYARWFISNHITTEWIGHRVKLSRFRYRSPDRPSVALVRPFSRVEACSACIDVFLVPGLVRITRKHVVGRVFNVSSAAQCRHVHDEPPQTDVAVLTPLWWMARLASGHFSDRERTTPVLALFGPSAIERRAASLVFERTHRMIGAHGAVLGEADVIAALVLRCALAFRVHVTLRLDEEDGLRVLKAAYTVPCALGALALATLPVWPCPRFWLRR